MTPGVSIITTCKGRLAHLKQTLPLMLAQQPHQAIVVDYDCPDRTAAWVTAEHPGASVAEVRPRPHFNLSEARNAGAATASGDLLFFIDADILVQPGLLNWIAQHWREGLYLRVEEPPRTGQGRSDRQYNGTVAVPRNAFEQIGGYDTAFHNWGSEDGDLYERLREAGHQCVRMPSRYFSSIPHDDDARVRFVPVKDLRTAEAVSRAYRRAKAQLARMGVTLDEATRQDLTAHIESNFVSSGRVPDYMLSHSGRTFRIHVHRSFRLFGRLVATVTEI
jgi:glycosyltransferase involved in cell wall biosynthesis